MEILEQWPAIEADLHERYGIDLDTPGLLAQRSWRWLQARIVGLLSVDSRLARALRPTKPST